MAKQSYKIPASLASGYLDMELSLQNKDGIGKVVMLRTILAWMLSLFGLIYALFQSPLSKGTFGQKFLFVLLWLIWTVILTKTDKTKRMKIQTVASLINYIPKSARHVLTRQSSKADALYGIVGIKSIEDGGLIQYTDGTLGYMYRVVGSASVLLFDQDRDAILSRVDAFYRKMKTDTELIFITTKEAQKVFRQVYQVKKLKQNLQSTSLDLQNLLQERFQVLSTDVGKNFSTIHQYLILKADNPSALTVAKNILQSEVESSTLMFKQCIPLITKEEVEHVKRIIYRREGA